jgi:hypothetical protein
MVAGVGFLVWGTSRPGGTFAAGGGGQVVTSKNGDSQVRLPAHWSPLQGLHERATIQAGNKQREEYLIVLSESKANFADDFTYRDYSRITREGLMKNIEQPKVVGEPTELLINGRRAVRYEIHGVSAKTRLKIVYLHTTVDGEKSFHQVLTWTLPTRLAEARAALEEATNSFRELP